MPVLMNVLDMTGKELSEVCFLTLLLAFLQSGLVLSTTSYLLDGRHDFHHIYDAGSRYGKSKDLSILRPDDHLNPLDDHVDHQQGIINHSTESFHQNERPSVPGRLKIERQRRKRSRMRNRHVDPRKNLDDYKAPRRQKLAAKGTMQSDRKTVLRTARPYPAGKNLKIETDYVADVPIYTPSTARQQKVNREDFYPPLKFSSRMKSKTEPFFQKEPQTSKFANPVETFAMISDLPIGGGNTGENFKRYSDLSGAAQSSASDIDIETGESGTASFIPVSGSFSRNNHNQYRTSELLNSDSSQMSNQNNVDSTKFRPSPLVNEGWIPLEHSGSSLSRSEQNAEHLTGLDLAEIQPATSAGKEVVKKQKEDSSKGPPKNSQTSSKKLQENSIMPDGFYDSLENGNSYLQHVEEQVRQKQKQEDKEKSGRSNNFPSFSNFEKAC